MARKDLTKEVLEDIEKNRNHSITEEIREVNNKKLDRKALYYRGKNITYREMLDEVLKYEKSFRALGVTKGMKVPMCISNSPEFVYSILACWDIGAIPKIFGEEFSEDYIVEILNSSSLGLAVIGDNKYSKINNALNKANISKIFMPSICDSLPDGKDPFDYIDEKFYKFENKTTEYKNNDSRIINTNEFKALGNNYEFDGSEELVHIDDIASVTFSSGSTNSFHPKGIVHDVKSYIAMGRNHDPKVSGVPSMKKLRVLAHIPTHSNTDVQSAITDSLIQGSTVCLEPVLYSESSILYSLLINQPNFACVTRSMCISLGKQIMDLKKRGVSVKMKWLLALMSVGEPTSLGEEKFINKMLRTVKAGTDFSHTPANIFPLSTAGADCEQGGILFQMFRSLKNITRSEKDNAYEAMRTYDMVDIVAVDENGNKLKNGQIGRLYATSPCTMIEYENDPEKTNEYFKVIDGKKYGDMSVYGYTLPKKEYVIKGRMGSEKMPVPCFEVSDAILKDTKNVMSCEVISFDEGYYVAHVEFQPNNTPHYNDLIPVYKRCVSILGKDLADKILFKVRSGYCSYPVTGCGKRSRPLLTEEGRTNTFKVINNGDMYNVISSDDYFNSLEEENKVIKNM